VTAISAAFVFGANLRQLTTPARYGQTWDAEISNGGPGHFSTAATQRTLARDASGITFGTYDSLRLDGHVVPAYGLQPVQGNTVPVAVVGRPARDVHEIALGARTLHELHRSVGQTVTADTGNGGTETLRIVGETLLPSLNTNDAALAADEGAQLTTAALDRIDPSMRNEIDFVLVRLSPHGSLARVRSEFPAGDYTVTGVAPPGDIASYGDVENTPLVLALLLTILGVGVLAHLLVTSVRTNRRELAVLKTMGCRRRQLRAMVIVQALLLAVVALAVGLVVGLTLGRAAWSHFVTGLGIPPDTQVPVGQLGALSAVTLVTAALIASLPARAATRVVPARVLRSE
jgi:putative ABC transport system permease protein